MSIQTINNENQITTNEPNNTTAPQPIQVAQKAIQKKSQDHFKWTEHHVNNSQWNKAANSPLKLFELSHQLKCESVAKGQLKLPMKWQITRDIEAEASLTREVPLFNKNVTADQLLNFYMGRPLDTKIEENDPEIPMLYIINWKTIKNYPAAAITLTSPIFKGALEKHLNRKVSYTEFLKCLFEYKNSEINNDKFKISISARCRINLELDRDPYTKPTMQEVANYFKSAPCWQDHCNVVCDKNRRSQITMADLTTYLDRKPTPHEIFNCAEGRELNAPISEEDFDRHCWRYDVALYLNMKLEEETPISMEAFKSRIGDATWQQHLNCNLGRPLTSPINLGELNNYCHTFYGRAPTTNERMNWILRRDLADPITDNDIDTHDWKFHINTFYNKPVKTFIGADVLKQFLGKEATTTEHVNCNMGKILSLGKNVSPKEHYKLVFDKEPSGNDLIDLIAYLNRSPTVKEMINWSLNRNLAFDYTEEEHKTRFPIKPPLSV